MTRLFASGVPRNLIALLLPVVLASVALPTTATAQVAARDSAGVRIVTSNVGNATKRISVIEREALRIGEEGGDPNYEFERIRHVMQTQSGQFVVADYGALNIRYFDAKGKFIRKLGRKGAGPGEFMSISMIALLPNDTLLVSDDLQRRLSVFSPTGEFVRTTMFESFEGKRSPDLLVTLTDGTIVTRALTISTLPPSTKPVYLTQHLFVSDGTGKAVSQIGTFGMSEHFVQATTKEMGGVAYWSLAYGRKMTVTSYGKRLLMGDGTASEVKLYSTSGKLEEIIRTNEARPKVESRDITMFRARASQGSRLPKDVHDRFLDEMPYPNEFPAFSRFLAVDNGQIWLQRYPRADSLPDRWIVLDRNGAFVDHVSLPRRFSLLSITNNHLLGVMRDEDGVQHVRIVRYVTAK